MPHPYPSSTSSLLFTSPLHPQHSLVISILISLSISPFTYLPSEPTVLHLSAQFSTPLSTPPLHTPTPHPLLHNPTISTPLSSPELFHLLCSGYLYPVIIGQINFFSITLVLMCPFYLYSIKYMPLEKTLICIKL